MLDPAAPVVLRICSLSMCGSHSRAVSCHVMDPPQLQADTSRRKTCFSIAPTKILRLRLSTACWLVSKSKAFPKVPWCHFYFSLGPAQTQGVEKCLSYIVRRACELGYLSEPSLEKMAHELPACTFLLEKPCTTPAPGSLCVWGFAAQRF